MARSPVDNGLDTLHIGLPSTIGTSVGVGYLNTEGHALATIITLRHSTAPPICMINHFKRALCRRLDMITEIDEKCKHFFTKFLTFFKFELIFDYVPVIISKKRRCGDQYDRLLQCTAEKFSRGISS